MQMLTQSETTFKWHIVDRRDRIHFRALAFLSEVKTSYIDSWIPMEERVVCVYECNTLCIHVQYTT